MTVNGYLSESDPDYRRLYLINVMLLFTLLVTIIFTQVHLFWTGITGLVVLNLSSFVLTLSATVYLRTSLNLERVATFLNAIAFGGLATYLIFRQDSNQVYLWAAAYFPFAFFLKGRRVGGYFAGAFYVLVVLGATINFTLLDPVPTTTLIRTLLNISTSLLAVCGMLYYYEATRADAIKRLSLASEELFKLSTTDALTGLYNRRYFDDVLPVILARAQREHERLGMLIIDADYFKAYNDYYGHPQGDQALKAIADVMTKALKRTTDLSFRLGGEEFGALYTVNEPEQALALAERIRTDLEARAIPSPKSPVGTLTVSIGLRLFDGSTQIGDLPVRDLVAEADQALYCAKNEGRNRVVVYQPDA